MELSLTVRRYLNRRILTVLLLGFASGLPLALCNTTLQAWFAVAGVDIVTIGFLGLVGLPYLYKFLWAPLMDRYVPPWLGRRRGWMLITQILLVVLILALGWFNPKTHAVTLTLLGLCIAFVSASQDTAINAYQADVLEPDERGMGAAMYTGGYRIAILLSGGIALILADHLGWRIMYLLMALSMGVGIVATFWAPEPAQKITPPSSLFKATVEPIKAFLTRDRALLLLVFLVLYKFGDAFALSLSSTFLIRGVGFSLTDVGVINKFMSLAGSLLGIFTGGILLTRLSLYQSLFSFGLLQAISNLLYMFVAIVGHHYAFAATAVFVEHLCGGLSTAAFVALLMSLCDQRYTATQFALFSALASVGRVIVGPFAGMMVKHVGWVEFYFWSFIFALPGLVLLVWLREQVTAPAYTVPANVIP